MLKIAPKRRGGLSSPRRTGRARAISSGAEVLERLGHGSTRALRIRAEKEVRIRPVLRTPVIRRCLG